MDIRVSVVVPVYNSEKYLKKCLDSLLNQTLKEIEVICVDDDSTDSSCEIIQNIISYDERFKYIKKKHEGYGAAAARNEGLKYASGKYLIFLDADDWFESTMLEKLSLKADQEEAEIVFFDGYIYDDVSKTLSCETNRITDFNYFPNKEVFSWKDIKECIFQTSSGWAWNKLYLREFVVKSGLLFQNVFHADDAFFSYSSLILAKRITSIREKFIYYRSNVPTGQTAQMDNSPLSAPKFVMKLREELIHSDVYEELRESFIKLVVDYCEYYLRSLKKRESFCELYEYLKTEIYPVLLSEKWPDTRDVYENVLKMQQIVSLPVLDYLFTYNKYYINIFNGLEIHFPYADFNGKYKVVIYGAGDYGKTYYMQLLFNKNVEVVGWVDRNYEKIGFPVQSISQLKELEYDYILIAVANKKVADEIRKNLIDQGIDCNKIYYKDIYEANISFTEKTLEEGIKG
ncbi:MAG: glycosyltransferase [Lachnospiraceae bacterium]|nr:glycosyltransferase [Lachnospiraceae bacterium]